jgi:hypothetical protein
MNESYNPKENKRNCKAQSKLKQIAVCERTMHNRTGEKIRPRRALMKPANYPPGEAKQILKTEKSETEQKHTFPRQRPSL